MTRTSTSRPATLGVHGALWAAAFLSLAAAPALSQPLPRWELGVGLSFLRLPDYRGSDQVRDYLLPYPYIIYRGKRLRLTEEGVRGLIYESPKVAVDLSINGSVPVKSADNAARRGMPNLDPTVEIGPSLKVRLANDRRRLSYWELGLPLRAVIATNLSHAHTIGWVFNPYLQYVRRYPFPHGRLRVTASVGPLWASAAYHAYYYSVDPRYATPERPAFRAKGGYSGTQLVVTLGKRLNDHFLLGAFLSYDNLSGASFVHSPLVRQKDSLMTGMALTWIFARSDERVEQER